MEKKSCSKCAASGERVHLVKCPICHKAVCETCVFNRGGRLFCSVFCADYFFFEEEE